VKKYLDYDVRDKDGWPIGLTPSDKIWAINLIESALRERGQTGLTLLEAHHLLFDAVLSEDRPPAFWTARMERWEMALTLKILEEARTKIVWIPLELRKEVVDIDD
jgi:hypothetical protein